MKGPLSHHLPGVFSVIFLSACGGGGGGSNLETSPSLNNAPEFVGVMEYSVDENTTSLLLIMLNIRYLFHI